MMTTEDRALFQRLADRVRQLEQVLNIGAYPQVADCPADPCHIHHPATDVTQESWYECQDGHVYNRETQVCRAPEDGYDGHKLWPQRRVLIAHAPEMYRALELVNRILSIGDVDRRYGHLRETVATLLNQIQTELKEATTHK